MRTNDVGQWDIRFSQEEVLEVIEGFGAGKLGVEKSLAIADGLNTPTGRELYQIYKHAIPGAPRSRSRSDEPTLAEACWTAIERRAQQITKAAPGTTSAEAVRSVLDAPDGRVLYYGYRHPSLAHRRLSDVKTAVAKNTGDPDLRKVMDLL